MEDVAARRRRLVTWLPPLLWAAALLFLSAQPAGSFPVGSLWHLDKLVHGCLYFVLGALIGRALASSAAAGYTGRTALVAAAIGLAAFGLLDEWSQSFSPGRTSSGADALADAVGACAGLLAASRYYRRRHGISPQLRR